MKYLVNILFFLFCSFSAMTQVGIGTDSPDANTVLHLVSTSGNQGVIIPKLSTSEMRTMVSASPQTGTLVFNTDSNEIYSFDSIGGKWYSLTPFIKELYSGSGARTGINMNKSAKVDRLDVTTGYGITPLGGIIMWSGKTAPDGWALCNGQTVNGYKTPNLQEKFIVGYAPSDADYNEPGNLSQASGNTTVGKSSSDANWQKSITLNHLPPHTHYFSGTTNKDGQHSHQIAYSNSLNGDGYYAYEGGNSGSNTKAEDYSTFYDNVHSLHQHNFSGTTGSSGAGNKFDVRPPYYVLAFIMRVK